MGTAPSSILHTIPESAPARTQKVPGDSERPEKAESRGSAKAEGSGSETRSPKSSTHKKSPFASLFRRTLAGRVRQHPEGELPEGALPEEVRSGKDRIKAPHGERSKAVAHSRKKKAASAGEEVLSRMEPLPEIPSKKGTSLLPHSSGKPPRSSRVLWGPQGHSPTPAPSLPTGSGVKEPVAVTPSVPVAETTAPSGASFSGEFMKSLPHSGPEKRSREIPKDQKVQGAEREIFKMEAEASPAGSRPAEKISLPERVSPQREGPSTGDEVSFAPKPSPFPLSEKRLERPPVHGPGEGSPSPQTPSPVGLEGAVSGASAKGESLQPPSLPEGLASRVGTLAREGGGEVALEVKPPHLGPVGVRVHVDPHTRLVTVELSSHDPRIRHLLSEKEGHIKESLSQTGFVLDRFQVVSQGSPGQDGTALQGLAAAGGGGAAGGGDGPSSGGGQESGVSGGSSQGQDLANPGRQEAGVPGRDGGRGGFPGSSSPEVEETRTAGEGGRTEASSPLGHAMRNTGYHRIA